MISTAKASMSYWRGKKNILYLSGNLKVNIIDLGIIGNISCLRHQNTSGHGFGLDRLYVIDVKDFVSLQNFPSQISPNVSQKVFPSDQCTRFIRTICADSRSVIVFIRLMKQWKIRYEVFLWTMRLMGKQN